VASGVERDVERRRQVRLPGADLEHHARHQRQGDLSDNRHGPADSVRRLPAPRRQEQHRASPRPRVGRTTATRSCAPATGCTTTRSGRR
jgi:hypothetical protein